MTLIDNLLLGFEAALSASNLLSCLLGVTLGTFIGVLPGIGPLVTISVLLPLTYGLSPLGGLIMLAGIYYGASYGGSTTAILLNLPGETSSVVTCLDGYQMARRGRAGAALTIAALASFAAGSLATFLIAFLAPPLGDLAIRFGAVEYTALIILALCATASLVRGSVLRGIGMALLGMLFGLIGTDIASGLPRFTFGYFELMAGLEFSVIAIGVFAVAEILKCIETPEKDESFTGKIGSMRPTAGELRQAVAPTLRGFGIGSLIGIIPGLGVSIASFASYMFEVKIARDPSRFGEGAVEGVAAPESANNAAAQTSFIPMLTLGVPGSAVMALMLGALMIQGVTPGPTIITEQPELFWGLIASMWIGNFLLIVLNIPLVGLWVSMLKVPYQWLYPAILLFSCIGIYSINGRVFDVYLTAIAGIFGYIFWKLRCEPAPFLIGFVMEPMLEENLRRALQISHGDATVFLTSPASLLMLCTAAVLVGSMMLAPFMKRRKDRLSSALASDAS